MGFIHYDPKPMNSEEARKIIEEQCTPNSCYFDYLKGRLIKTEISKDKLDLYLYERDNTHVDIKSVINNLKESQTAIIEHGDSEAFSKEESSLITHNRPSRADEYLPYFTKKIIDLNSVVNPHTGREDLGSLLAMVDLEGKCKDDSYKDSYIKEKLISFDLYPWEWTENSEVAVTILCDLITAIGNIEDKAKAEIHEILDGFGF